MYGNTICLKFGILYIKSIFVTIFAVLEATDDTFVVFCTLWFLYSKTGKYVRIISYSYNFICSRTLVKLHFKKAQASYLLLFLVLLSF